MPPAVPGRRSAPRTGRPTDSAARCRRRCRRRGGPDRTPAEFTKDAARTERSSSSARPRATVRTVRVEPVAAHHRPALVDFVAAITERARAFVDRQLISQVKVATWTQAVPERRLVAEGDDGSVSGLVTVSPGVGWSSHTAEIGLIVRSDRRQSGVGRALAAAGIELARSIGIEKLTVETMAANAG